MTRFIQWRKGPQGLFDNVGETANLNFGRLASTTNTEEQYG